jgi:hypothetical protein
MQQALPSRFVEWAQAKLLFFKKICSFSASGRIIIQWEFIEPASETTEQKAKETQKFTDPSGDRSSEKCSGCEQIQVLISWAPPRGRLAISCQQLRLTQELSAVLMKIAMLLSRAQVELLG